MPWPQSLPLALLRIRTRPRTKTGLSPFEVVYGRPSIVQTGISTQVGEELLSNYVISMQRQLRKTEKLVLGTRARGLDGPVHNIEPGDYISVRSLSDSHLELKWEGPFQVLLTPHTAIKIQGQAAWIHHTTIKKAPKPRWTLTPTGPLRL